jgi:hypothetical protein
MTTPLITLMYCSHGRIGDHERADSAIHDILVSARTNNAREKVTGALLYSMNCFAQILEGPEEAVERIFARLQHDSRHHDIVVLIKAPITERRFPDWSMAFTSAGDVVQDLTPAAFRQAFAHPDEAAGMELLKLIEKSMMSAQMW